MRLTHAGVRISRNAANGRDMAGVRRSVRVDPSATVADLKAEAKAAGLPVSGTKSELKARITGSAPASNDADVKRTDA